MAPFGRLTATLLGYLTPGATPRNQRWTHERPQTPETPTRSANGKRPHPSASQDEPNKRRRMSDYLTSPLSRATPSKGGSAEESEPNADTDQSRGINNPQARSNRASPVTTPDGNKPVRRYATPQSRLQTPEDTSSVQPYKLFDEADLKRFEIEKARAAHAVQADNMRRAGFSEDPIKVYLKIVMRGWEAIFPKCWRFSFESLPSILFANDRKHEYIKALSENQFRGMKAFRGLLDIGARARDATLEEVDAPPSRQPQELIRREIKKFMKWAFADGDVSDLTPTLTVLSAPGDIEPEVLERKMTRRLLKLKRAWKEKLTTCLERDDDGDESSDAPGQLCAAPAIYGISISDLAISIVVLQDDDEDGHGQPIVQQFFWKLMDDVDYDVWNTIAIAIVVMHCRTKMMNLKAVLDDYFKAAQAD